MVIYSKKNCQLNKIADITSPFLPPPINQEINTGKIVIQVKYIRSQDQETI